MKWDYMQMLSVFGRCALQSC